MESAPHALAREAPTHVFIPIYTLVGLAGLSFCLVQFEEDECLAGGGPLYCRSGVPLVPQDRRLKLARQRLGRCAWLMAMCGVMHPPFGEGLSFSPPLPS